MLATLLTFALTTPAPKWDLAVCTRFYNPVGDKHKTHPGLYLMTLDGKQKVALSTKDPENEFYIDWKDHNHVVWLEKQGSKYQVMELDLTNWRRRVAFSWPVSYSSELPDKAQQWLGDPFADPKEVGAKARIAGSRSAIVFSGKSLPIQNPTARVKIDGDIEGEVSLGLAELAAIDPEEGGFGLSTYGKVGSWEMVGYRVVYDAHISFNALFRVDHKTQKAWIVPVGPQAVSVRPARDLWAGRGTRNLGDYTKPDVWANTVTVGRITGGEPRIILKGRSFTYVVSLRP